MYRPRIKKRQTFQVRGGNICMDSIQEAVKILKQGGIVVYPTDTVYGLAVDATNVKAVDKLYKLKGRDFKKPIHVIIPIKHYNTIEYDSKLLNRIVKLNREAKKLMIKFWPGPLTIVLLLLAKGKSWQKLSAGTGSLGVRYPANLTSQALCEALKRPITTTSANVSDKPDCYSVIEVKNQFKKFNPEANGKPDFYLDGGKLKKTSPSTVVSLVKDVKILRVGPISERQIREAVRGK